MNFVLLCLKEIEKMLKQAKHLSTAGQLLLISVKMLSVDLDVFNAEIVARLDTYIHLQTMLLKQVRNVMLFVLYRCVNLLLLSYLYFMMFIISAKARDYVFTGVGLSVSLSVCLLPR